MKVRQPKWLVEDPEKPESQLIGHNFCPREAVIRTAHQDNGAFCAQREVVVGSVVVMWAVEGGEEKSLKASGLRQGRKGNAHGNDPCPNPHASGIDFAEVEHADDDTHGGGDIADLTQVGWTADLLEAEEH